MNVYVSEIDCAGPPATSRDVITGRREAADGFSSYLLWFCAVPAPQRRSRGRTGSWRSRPAPSLREKEEDDVRPPPGLFQYVPSMDTSLMLSRTNSTVGWNVPLF